jgi:hypothetical protein
LAPKINDNLKILFCEWAVKGEIVSPNCPHFPAKIADFRFKYCILRGNTKNKTSGRNPNQDIVPIPKLLNRQLFIPWMI